MIKIYHTQTRAIIADEKSKVFYYATIQEAREIKKSKKATLHRKDGLVVITETLLNNNWKEKRKW